MSPAVSTRQLLHFLQLHVTGKFQHYDHGADNLLHYNSHEPPLYNLGNVTAPIYLYAASEDTLISHHDVARLSKLLPNVINFQIHEDWNHMDPLLGKNSRELYSDILNAIIDQIDNKINKRLS